MLFMIARLAPALVLTLVFGIPRQSRAEESGQRRVVAVSVIDRDGNPVSDLTAANFRGKVRGQDVTILSAWFDTTSPRRIAVVVDASRSMEPAWKGVWATVADIVAQL